MGGMDGGTSYDLQWVLGPYRCLLVRLSSRVGLVASNASTFLPTPDPARSFFTHRPTDCFAIDCPGRALSPCEHRLRSSVDQSKRAIIHITRTRSPPSPGQLRFH